MVRGGAAHGGTVPGTALSWLDRGLLLLGRSGAGKSDLALRLIELGGRLVADDLVRLEVRGDRLVARAHAAQGLIELRGQGIFRLPALDETMLDVCIELVADDGGDRDRLPAPGRVGLAGLALPCYRLDPFAASATARSGCS